MAVRKPTRSGQATRRQARRKRASEGRLRRLSALAGGLLICAVVLCAVWLLASQQNAGLAFRFPFAIQNQPTAQASVEPLKAAGVVLGTPAAGQTTGLTQAQALLLANQIEPEAAAHAGSIEASYVLVSYTGKTSALDGLRDVPAWLVHYVRVVSSGPDTSADPHATNAPHDCYLFLDAQSGQELFAIWS